MAIDETDVAQIAILLSPERIARLGALTGSTRKAIELHQETLRVGTSLMNVLATMEIALRNSVSENLSLHFGNPDWLTNPPKPFQWKDVERNKVNRAVESARRAEYSKLSQNDKAALDGLAFPNGKPANMSHSAKTKRRQACISVSEGKVIAEITMHFWKRIYGPDYDQTLWRTSLKKTFPNKSLKRADVANNLEIIYQNRNRLAHHEPVLYKRFTETMKAVSFVTDNLGTQRDLTRTPLSRLVEEDVAIVNEMANGLHAKLDSYRISSP